MQSDGILLLYLHSDRRNQYNFFIYGTIQLRQHKTKDFLLMISSRGTGFKWLTRPSLHWLAQIISSTWKSTKSITNMSYEAALVCYHCFCLSICSASVAAAGTFLCTNRATAAAAVATCSWRGCTWMWVPIRTGFLWRPTCWSAWTYPLLWFH